MTLPVPAPPHSVQLFLLLALLMALFTLTSSAQVVALGLYEDYLRQHRWLYSTAVLALATYAGHRAFSLVRAVQLLADAAVCTHTHMCWLLLCGGVPCTACSRPCCTAWHGKQQ
jgi:hypothetical protein